MFVSLMFGTLFGLLIFNTFTHLQIAARSRWPRREIFLLASIGAILVYSVATFLEYGSSDTSVYFFLLRVQVICEPLFFIAFLEFFLAVSEEPRSRTLVIFEVAFVLFAVLRQFLPYTGAYSSVVGLKPYVLPWGESVNLIDGRASWFFMLFFAFVLAAIALGARLLLSMYRKGRRRESLALLAALAILLGGIFLDFAVATDMLRWIYMTEVSYVAVTLVASLEVTHEVVKFAELKKALELSLAEKIVLIREIHHRVKNNLQVIASLLSLQAGEAGSEAARAALLECTERVQSMSLVHQHLYSAENFVDVNFRDYSAQLIAGLRSTYGVDETHVAFESRIEGIEIGIDLAVPLGLILNELVTNSIKHGLSREGHLCIMVRASRSTGRIMFEYGDDGPGFRPGFDPDRDGNLGLTLIRALGAQLGAAGGFQPRQQGLAYQIDLPPDQLNPV